MKFLIILMVLSILYLPIAWVLDASGYNARSGRKKGKFPEKSNMDKEKNT